MGFCFVFLRPFMFFLLSPLVRLFFSCRALSLCFLQYLLFIGIVVYCFVELSFVTLFIFFVML